MTTTDWNPERYAQFAGLRLRPAVDLLTRVSELPEGAVYDLGCGNGAVGPVLAERFSGRAVIGIDTSPAMLEKAVETGAYDRVRRGDIASWKAETPAALIFSNAALHWLDGHEELLPRLAGQLARGGTLAVQVPHQNRAPSHHIWTSLLQELFPDRLDRKGLPGVLLPAQYHHLLSPLGEVDLWETEYYQRLPASDEGHPVRRFTESTFARPILEVLEAEEQAALIREYEAVIGTAYPANDDGSVLLPFRRLFFTLRT